MFTILSCSRPSRCSLFPFHFSLFLAPRSQLRATQLVVQRVDCLCDSLWGFYRAISSTYQLRSEHLISYLPHHFVHRLTFLSRCLDIRSRSRSSLIGSRNFQPSKRRRCIRHFQASSIEWKRRCVHLWLLWSRRPKRVSRSNTREFTQKTASRPFLTTSRNRTEYPSPTQ